jgi:hypothetical protein
LEAGRLGSWINFSAEKFMKRSGAAQTAKSSKMIFFDKPVGFFIYNSAWTDGDNVDDVMRLTSTDDPKSTCAVSAEICELVFQLLSNLRISLNTFQD